MAQQITPLVHAQQKSGQGLPRISRTGHDPSFAEVLARRVERDSGVAFSAHARARLEERGMHLGGDDLARLTGAVQSAASKGSADSLVLLDDKAFIVSVTNNTVVTAMTGDSLKGNVFTNIDSTVIA